MSRVGKMPVVLPEGVTVKVEHGKVLVSGPKGTLERMLPAGIAIASENGRAVVERPGETATSALHGTVRSLLAGMVGGVTSGYTRDLEISGVGFRAQMQGRKLVMSLGFSHPVEYEAPEDVQIELKDNQHITVSGLDKQRVGQTAARIRSFCPVEPYKGKGIRYQDEHVRRKAGKTVA